LGIKKKHTGQRRKIIEHDSGLQLREEMGIYQESNDSKKREIERRNPWFWDDIGGMSIG
jgi:hypothetical protein